MKYLLLITKSTTGQVLDPKDNKSFFYSGSGEAYPYIIIDNLADAEKEAQCIIDKNPNVEVVIFDENENVVKYILSDYIPPPPVIKRKWWKFW